MGAPLILEDFKDNFDPFTALYAVAGEGRILDPQAELLALSKHSPVLKGDLQETFGLLRQVTIGDQPGIHGAWLQ